MSIESARSTTLSLEGLPLTALNVGVWEDTPAVNRVRGDAVMARIFGLSQADAADGITWERLASIFHPDDLAADTAERRRVRETGGLFAWDHRVVPEPGLVRWVLARGYFRHESEGALCGRGIVIDVTDGQWPGHMTGSAARFDSAHDAAHSPLQVAADHAIMLVRSVERLSPAGAAKITPFLKPMLYEIGCQIAAAIVANSNETEARPNH